MKLLTVLCSLANAIGEMMTYEPANSFKLKERVPTYGYYTGDPIARNLAYSTFSYERPLNYSSFRY